MSPVPNVPRQNLHASSSATHKSAPSRIRHLYQTHLKQCYNDSMKTNGRMEITPAQARFLRQYSQHLIPRQPDERTSVAQVVRHTCGIQAQDARAAALAIHARSTGLVAGDVERARLRERSIVRTWGPRGTLHLLATEDLDWLLSLFGPVFIAGDRKRRLQLGLDDETSARGAREIRDILADQGSLTRGAGRTARRARSSPCRAGQAAPDRLCCLAGHTLPGSRPRLKTDLCPAR
jgi:hypothetical protein